MQKEFNYILSQGENPNNLTDEFCHIVERFQGKYSCSPISQLEKEKGSKRYFVEFPDGTLINGQIASSNIIKEEKNRLAGKVKVNYENPEDAVTKNILLCLDELQFEFNQE